MAKKVLRVDFLERIDTPFGEITVARVRKTGAVLYRQGNCHQSEGDPRGVSLSTYIHAIFGLLRQAEAKSVLLIGCGGGTLATMLSAEGVRTVLVDINPWSFEIARRYFGLPDSIDRHVADGAAYIAAGKTRFDAIVLDAYHASLIPDHLTTPDFFRACAKRLTKRGCLIANVFTQNDSDDAAPRLADSMRAALPQVRMLDEPGGIERNAILMAGNVDSLQRPWLMVKPQGGADVDIRAELSRLRFVGMDERLRSA